MKLRTSIYIDRETGDVYKQITVEHNPIFDEKWTSEEDEIITIIDDYTKDEFLVTI